MNFAWTILFVFIVGSICFRILRWLTTPLLRRMGFYTYYAPLFFIQPFGRGQVEIHLGTTWDLMWARQLTARTLMSSLVQGVSGVVADAKSGRLERSLKLRATTYFLSEETLLKFGFTVRRPNPFEYFAFAANYLEVFLIRCIVAGRPRLIDIRRLRMAEITIERLIENEVAFGRLIPILIRSSGRSQTL
ncbi:MAG: hypothetical protein FGM32_00080 [Candidatus Kapabacteria bacterium]|nr:hypothetical protein [Candidatus Kapabacteria bacterium]